VAMAPRAAKSKSAGVAKGPTDDTDDQLPTAANDTHDPLKDVADDTDDQLADFFEQQQEELQDIDNQPADFFDNPHIANLLATTTPPSPPLSPPDEPRPPSHASTHSGTHDGTPGKLDEDDTHFFGHLFALTFEANVVAMLLLLGLSAMMTSSANGWWEKVLFVTVGVFCAVSLAVVDRSLARWRVQYMIIPIVSVVVMRIVITLASSDEVLQTWWEGWLMNNSPYYVTAMWVVGGLSVAVQPISRRFALIICSCPLIGGLLIALSIFVRTGEVRGLTTFVPIYSLTFPGTYAVARTIAAYCFWPESQLKAEPGTAATEV